MVRTLLVALAAVTVTVGGCGSSSDPDTKALGTVERATRAVNRALGVQTAFVTAGNVNVGATPEIIATAIYNRVLTEAAGCVAATQTGATVHADFGASCALATAMMHVGGTVDLVVMTNATGGIDLVLTLALTIDGGQALGGTLTVSTKSGDSFTYAGTLTLQGSSVTVPLVQAGLGAGGATLDATHATADGSDFELAAVHQRFAACYPDDGVATLGAVTVTFASDTPQTAAVTLAGGKSDSLPGRAGCPN